MKALITGATSGIGKEIALILAKKGIDLVLASRNEGMMNELKDELSDKVKVDCIAIDLSKENAAINLYNQVISNNHKVDILINNAGFGLFGSNNSFEPKLLEGMTILNITSLTVLCRLFGLDMSERGNGYILNVASTAAFQPIPYFSAYSASKSYVLKFSNALHHELKNMGVGVTCLNPGPTETNFFKVALNGEKFPPFQGKKMMSASEVAGIGVNAMFKKKISITSGLTNKIFRVLMSIVPLKIVEKVLRNFTKK